MGFSLGQKVQSNKTNRQSEVTAKDGNRLILANGENVYEHEVMAVEEKSAPKKGGIFRRG